MFTWKGKNLVLALFVSSFCIVFVFSPVYIIFIQMQFLYVLYLINFTFNDFTFSIKHYGFNQKTITHIFDIVFITQFHIFLSEIHLNFLMKFLVLKFVIGRWSVGWSSVHLVGGWFVDDQIFGWQVVRWLVDRFFLRKPRKIS